MELTRKNIKSDVLLNIIIEGGKTLKIDAHTQILAHSSEYFFNAFYGDFSENDGTINIEISEDEVPALLALLYFIYNRELPKTSVEDIIRCITLNSYFAVKNIKGFLLDRIHSIHIGSVTGIAFLDSILLDNWESHEWYKIKKALLFTMGNLNHNLLLYLGTLEASKLKILMDNIFHNDIHSISIALFWLYVNKNLKGFYLLIKKDILRNLNTALFYRNGKIHLEEWCALNNIEYSNPPIDDKKVDDRSRHLEFEIPELFLADRSFTSYNFLTIRKGEKKTFYMIGNNTVLDFDVEYKDKEIIVIMDLCKLVKHNTFDNSYAKNIKIYKLGEPIKMIPRNETEEIVFLYRDDWKHIKEQTEEMLQFFIHTSL